MKKRKNDTDRRKNDTDRRKKSPPCFPPNLLGKRYIKLNQKSNVVTLVPSAVFLYRNFFTQEECNAWIQHAEQNIGFESMNSPQTREYAQRVCGRIQMNDWSMAELIYQRMIPLVDRIASQVVVSNVNASYRPVCCNENLRMYKYEKGMSFGRHYDGSNSINRFQGGNTEITVLIYLSSCEGGATRFHLPLEKNSIRGKPNKKAKSGQADTDENSVSFVPEAGAILMHLHGDRCLAHEADPVLKNVKYVLRTDIVYAYSD